MQKTFLLGAASIALLVPGLAPAITIDTFSGEQLTSDVPASPPPPDFSEAADGTVLGGARDVEAVNDDAAPDATTANVQFGGFSVSNASGDSGSGILTYDGTDMSPDVATMGLGGLDITMGVDGAFVFDVISNDLPWTYTIQVWDDDSDDIATGMIELSNNGGNLTESLPFSSFSGIDFTNVGAVQLIFSGVTNADLTIDNLRTVGDIPPPTDPVPLPASAFMMIGGIAGLGWVGHRRRRRS